MIANTHPRVCERLVYVRENVVDVFIVTGFDALLRVPAGLVLLDGDLNTDRHRRGGAVNPEGSRCGIVEVSSVLESSSTSDGCSAVIALLVFPSISIE